MKTLFKKQGEVILEEGEESTDAYIILEGEVDILKKNKVIATLNENSLFGEIGLVDQRPRTATCVAKTNCILGAVTKENYMILLENRPKVVLPILRLITDRMRSLMQFVEWCMLIQVLESEVADSKLKNLKK